jgi:hypothetical protein
MATKKHRYVLGKVDYNSSGRRNCEAAITWELQDGRFSMSAEIWNPCKSDIYYCGQCVDTVAAYFPDDRKARRMVEIWRRWHLNDMKADCEHQREESWDKRPIDPAKPLNTYGKHFPGQSHDTWNMLAWVRRDEHPDGLLSHPCPVCGYKYGTAWNREEIPDEVLAEIATWSAREE